MVGIDFANTPNGSSVIAIISTSRTLMALFFIQIPPFKMCVGFMRYWNQNNIFWHS